MREFSTSPDDGPELPEHWVELEYQVGLASMLKVGNPDYPRHKIGRFEAIRIQGWGGFGAVFKAYDPELERIVALKLVRPLGRNAAQRVLKEARALAKISHPNVITVLETGQYGEDRFFTMEYVDGETVADFCGRRPWPTWQDFVDIYLLAGAGLAAAHKAGVVHGDFKPTNILINRDGTWPRVADFGLAKIIIQNAAEAERDEYCRRGGTLPYMAPEVLRGMEPDARSDQFSFCVALWQAVERVLPFVGADSRDMLEQIDAAEPWFTGDYGPEALRDVLRVGLSKDPNDRYPDMDALLEAIAEVRRTELAADVEHDTGEVSVVDERAAVEPPQSTVDVEHDVVAESRGDCAVVEPPQPAVDAEHDAGEVLVVDESVVAESRGDCAEVEPPQPATSPPPPPPKGPGWGAFTAALLFAAVSLAVSASQRLSASPTARGKGLSLLEADPRLATASACAVTRAETGHPVPPVVEGVCRTIRLGDVKGAADMWAGSYSDRVLKAGRPKGQDQRAEGEEAQPGQVAEGEPAERELAPIEIESLAEDDAPSLDLAVDSLIVARTFVDQAETFLMDGLHEDATKAARQALKWSTLAASRLGKEHAGAWFVSLRAKRAHASAQSQHSTTPLPSMEP